MSYICGGLEGRYVWPCQKSMANRTDSMSIHVKPRSHRPSRRHTTTYDGGESCCNHATSQPSGVIARCIGSFCDVQKPGCDSKHRRIILLVVRWQNGVLSPGWDLEYIQYFITYSDSWDPTDLKSIVCHLGILEHFP